MVPGHGGSPYHYGPASPAGPDYADFGIEAQAQMVCDWFGRHADWNNPTGTLPGGLSGKAALNDTYFRYINGNIRIGMFLPADRAQGAIDAERRPHDDIPTRFSPRGRTGTDHRTAGDAAMPLYMTWRGTGDDQALYWSRNEDGRSWTGQRHAVGASVAGPALEEWRGRVYMAWRGVAGDQRLFWATFDGQNWSGQQQVPEAGSSHGPALVGLRDGLFLYWKGASDDPRVWYSRFDGAGWLPQQPAGGDHGPLSVTGPAATGNLTSRPFMTVVSPGHHRLEITESPDGAQWSGGNGYVPGGDATTGPGLSGRPNIRGSYSRLLMAWGGPGGTIAASPSYDSGYHWNAPVAQQAATADRPALRGWASVEPYAAWRGPGDDHNLYWADTAGGTRWLNPLNGEPGGAYIPGRGSMAGPALVAYGSMWR